MSITLLTFVDNFLIKESDPVEFVEGFIRQWKLERDNGKILDDDPQLSEVLSSLFCLADMFNPNANREEYELDETRLRNEMEELLRQYRFQKAS